MPIAVSYPGVYIQEIPSNVKAAEIAAAPTSVAGFVGRTPFGPVDLPGRVHSFDEFTRCYGGLASDFPLGYAVRDFFENGGSEAVIARLFEPAEGEGVARLRLETVQGEAPSAGGQGPVLVAASPGAWGNRLAAEVDKRGISAATARQFSEYGLGPEDLFNLTLMLTDASGATIASERFLNLSARLEGEAGAFPNRLDRTLAANSSFARAELPPGAKPPASGSYAASGGDDGTFLRTATYLGDRGAKTGIYLLEHALALNLLCIPPDRRIESGAPERDLDTAVLLAAAAYCAERRAMFIIDPPSAWSNALVQDRLAEIDAASLGIFGADGATAAFARNAAVYFPCIWKEDPATSQQALFAPCGAVAGVIAATDSRSGVWTAPAGIEARLTGVENLAFDLTDEQIGTLTERGINCLRSVSPTGPVLWGARTLIGADAFDDDYKYIPMRRLALFVEESLYRGTSWAVLEPNDETLWSALRWQVGRFMDELVREGAFSNYNVSCGATTTSNEDIDRGVVNILLQFAPVRPAEFVTILIEQVAGLRGLGAGNPPMHSAGLRSIALVTAAIAARVGTAIASALPGAAVRVGAPRAAPAGEIEASVTLYRVTPNDPSRNAPPAVLAAEGSPPQRPPAVLDLHYLLTLASDRPFAVELMVASVVSSFDEVPQIERAELIAAADRVPGGGFEDISPALHPESLSMEEYLALSAACSAAPGLFLSYVVPGIALGAEIPVPSA